MQLIKEVQSVEGSSFFPSNVEFYKGNLFDSATDESFDCNETVIEILRGVNGKSNVETLAIELAGKYNISLNEAITDVTLLFEKLNQKHLLNVIKKGAINRVKYLMINIFSLQFDEVYYLFNTKRRYDIPMSWRPPHLLFIYFIYTLIIMHPLIFLSILLFFVSSPEIDFLRASLFTLNILLAMTVHELFHILALYSLKENDKLAFIGKDRFSIGVYGRNVSPVKSIIVSAAGPLIPFFIGIVLYVIGRVLESSDLRFLSIIWIANIATLLSTDGKNILAAILKIRRKTYENTQ